jgi:hypothetical protein
MYDSNNLNLKIKCYNLPGTVCGGEQNIRLGIQKGNEVIDDVPGDLGDTVFNAAITYVKNGNGIKFSGPFVQGKSYEKFIYLSWGQRNGDGWRIIRRAKLHLNILNSYKILKSNRPIEAHVDMTDEKGEHLCASVKNRNIKWVIPV